MSIEWDPAKRERNLAVHGLDFADFAEFDEAPILVEDNRYAYGEKRLRAYGRLAGVAHTIVFTWRGSSMRLISFRRAREKEMRRYE